MNPAWNQAAEDRIGGLIIVQGEVADFRFDSGAQNLTHSSDDVATHAKLAKRPLEVRLQMSCGLAQPVQPNRGAQVFRPCSTKGEVWGLRRHGCIPIDLALEACKNLAFAARTELEGDVIGRPIKKGEASVPSADHEVPAIVSTPADLNVDMRIARIPMIDRDPVELGAEIRFNVALQLAVNVLRPPSTGPSSGEMTKPNTTSIKG